MNYTIYLIFIQFVIHVHAFQPYFQEDEDDAVYEVTGVPRIFKDTAVQGPESIVILNNELYTTSKNGEVLRIGKNKITPIFQFVRDAEGGRPQGLYAGPDGLLYIADNVEGIFQFNVSGLSATQLVSRHDVIDGSRCIYFNAVAASSNGNVFWSCSSTINTPDDYPSAFLPPGTGKLVMYNRRIGRNVVLIDGLHFANGVAISPDESFVLVSETETGLIHQYWLKGPNRLTSNVFTRTLPGLPDNIQAGPNGFVVSLIKIRDIEFLEGVQEIYKHRALREFFSFVVKSFNLSKRFNDLIDAYFGDYRGRILTLSLNGEIMNQFDIDDGTAPSISDAVLYGDNIVLGSPVNDFLGIIRNPAIVSKFKFVFERFSDR